MDRPISTEKKIKDLSKLPAKILEAKRLIEQHTTIMPYSFKKAFVYNGEYYSELVCLQYQIIVSLPSRARKEGKSKTGVKRFETVIFGFPKSYPSKAPVVLLRNSFNRELPHIYPSLPNHYVYPCIYEGDLTDLLHQENGLFEIINQVSDWLTKAASDNLIDKQQGWEPIRRDEIYSTVIYDSSKMAEAIKTKQQGRIFRALINYNTKKRLFDFIHVRASDNLSVDEVVTFLKIIKEDNAIWAQIPGVLVWPDEGGTQGQSVVIDNYLPDTVSSLKELFERAKSYGCYNTAYSILQSIYTKYIKKGLLTKHGLYVVIILCVKRPCNLINDSTPYEFIPYLINCTRKESLDINSKVMPLSHRHEIGKKLLRQMSGSQEPKSEGHIVQIGCGSLGSKIGMHLAKLGHGPFMFIDKGKLYPHNIARHALHDTESLRSKPKAFAMFKALDAFSPQNESSFEDQDIVECLGSKDFLPDKVGMILDSTASTNVREFLSGLDVDNMSHRIVSVALYSQGKIGAMFTEGPNRNPRLDDLYLKMIDHCLNDANFADRLYDSSTQIGRQLVGQSCSSFTAVIPDTTISLYAASFAERARNILEANYPHEGELLLGELSVDKIGINWTKRDIGKTAVIKKDSWEIRLLDTALNTITHETDLHKPNETGGVLFGRISLIRRCITITRTLPAPSDSKRSPAEFILGTEGLTKIVNNMQTQSRVLRYIGTWHSHPMGGNHSTRDISALEKMKTLRLGVPSILLIHKPDGFDVIMDAGQY